MPWSIVDCFDTVVDVVRAGKALYDDGVFSVQEVTGRSIDLGITRMPVFSGHFDTGRRDGAQHVYA